ncbi:MAG: hypothetical protein EOM20_12950 [Spartobacteria bacterium]|nr:hypothetical protein [Spartobacteria bacterium]
MKQLKVYLERIDADGMIRHSFIVMVFTHMASVANLAFHVVMGRTLSAVEYGILSSMLGVMLIIVTPLVAIQSTLAHFAARLRESGNTASVWALVRVWYLRLSLVGCLLLVVGLVGRHTWAAFWHLESTTPIILVSFTSAGILMLPLIPGVMQGLQSFIWMCVALNLWGIIRFVIGSVLVLGISASAVWGLTGQLIGTYCGLAVGWLGLWMILHGKETGEKGRLFSGSNAYFLWSFFALLFFGLLMNADIVMVRHYFAPEEAGMFAQVATIGRTVIFLCQPIAVALFPKVVSTGSLSGAQRKTLIRGIIMVILLVGGVAFMVTLLPWLPLLVMFNVSSPSPEQVHLVRCLIWAMAPLALTFLLLNFEMAQNRFIMILPLAVLAACYLGGVALWHTSLLHVILVLGFTSLGSAVALLFCLPWRGREGVAHA